MIIATMYEENPWMEYLYRQQLETCWAYLHHTRIRRGAACTGKMGRPLVVAWRGTTAQRRAWWANNLNVWSFIQSMVGQEGDTRRMFVNNVAGMNIDENSSRIQRSQDIGSADLHC
jgi:hypothetical protein